MSSDPGFDMETGLRYHAQRPTGYTFRVKVAMGSVTVNASEAPTTSPPPSSDVPTMEIRPRTGWQSIDFRELWFFRDLLWVLALRDIQVRYKQTALGVLWAIIQPIATVVVFAVIVGGAMGVGEEMPVINGRKVPYAVFVFAGQLPWIFFSNSVSTASMSLLANANMLRKIYFPRLIMPMAALGAPIVDFALSFLVLIFVMIGFSVEIQWQLLLMPLLIFSTLFTALGVGNLLSALSVSYRDFKYVVPFMIQLWFWFCPVIYPVKLLPTEWAWVLYLNPMYGPIEGFRSVVLGTEFNYSGFAVSTGVGFVIFIIGLFYFARVERRFADIV